MRLPPRCAAALLLLSLTPLFSPAADTPAVPAREVENLAVFARVYGYVRFFYPSDEAALVDWDKLAILGAEEARNAADPDALRAALLRVLSPIAPQLRITRTGSSDSPASANTTAARERLTFWQYHGVKVPGTTHLYDQRRVITGGTVKGRQPLFQPVVVPPPFTAGLTPDLALTMPTTLPIGDGGRTAAGDAAAFDALQARLAALDLKSLAPADWRLRVGGIVTVWNVFQHFHPYLDQAGVRWDEALRPALRRTLRDAPGEDYRATLMELVAQTGDGHGYVYGGDAEQGGLPYHAKLIEGRIVVTAVEGEAPLRKGDILQRIDDRDALDVLREIERHTPGSPHLRRHRALHQFGEGRAGSAVQLELLRDGETIRHELLRDRNHRGYFFKTPTEFTFPDIAEVAPGIYYVNLFAAAQEDYLAKLPQLAEARGVIFDQRWDGRRIDDTHKRLQPHGDIIPHLIAATIHASPMLVPQVTQPDRVGWTYRESSWPVQPKAPRFKGRVVFINEPSVVSYGETCMAMIAHHQLATLVGEPTAGTNGNVNFIELPGGFRVMWTGMDVRKHDHTPFYGVGFGPDVPVKRTLSAVKEGRDEYLEAALAAIENPR